MSPCGYEFIYHKYDALNRLVETGEYNSTSMNDFTQTNADNPSFPSSNTLINKKYVYDTSSTDPLAAGQQNLQGRFSYAENYDRNGNLAYTDFYSYDDVGNVEWVVHKWTNGHNAKEIYTRDLQGRITQKELVDNDGRHMYYFYAYNQPGRLDSVSTDTVSNGTNKVTEGLYTYYATGKVKRLLLGHAQGVDYVYNTRDWLQMINQQNLNTSQDPGGDGANGIPVDKYGEVIGYDISSNIGSAFGAPKQYNGNISWMMYNMSGVDYSGTSLVGDTYAYDKVNRLHSANFGYYSGGWKATSAYDAGFSYDHAGNDSTLYRYGSTGGLQDNLTYHYASGTNRLTSLSGSSSATYNYDGNGNVISDTHRGIAFVLYNIDNLPEEVFTTSGQVYTYTYDENGQRVTTPTKYFINNASGQNEAIVDMTDHSTITYNIQANSNIGQVDRKVQNGNTTLTRYYYLKDHLGSIKMTVNASGTVVGHNDYFPYGSFMDNRSLTSSAEIGYKFTGKYRDTETDYDYFGARYYDSWTGRFLSVDPMSKKYPSFSPYNYTFDNPLRLVDPHGESVADPYKGPLPCCKTYPRSFPEWGNNFTPFLTTKIKTTAKTAIENVGKYADQTSKASDKTEATGIGMALVGGGASLVAPESGAEGMTATGLALAVFSKGLGTGADYVSATTKWIDAGFFGGSKTAAINQTIKVLIDVGLGKVYSKFLPESKSVATEAAKEGIEMMSKQNVNKQLGIQQ